MDAKNETNQNETNQNGMLLGASAILFFLTLLAGAIPVYLIDYFQDKNNKNKLNITNNSNENGLHSTTSSTSRLNNASSNCTKSTITKDCVLQFLIQLGGGVLMYTAFIHMLPEIREHYEYYLKTKKSSIESVITGDDGGDDDGGLPVVDLCALGGFFAIFLIEELMHNFFLKGHDHHHHGVEMSKKVNNDGNMCDAENISNFETIVNPDRGFLARVLDAFFIILAFSCHAIFDGISIGVQNGSKIWTVLIAILSHKILIAFILAIQIYERCFKITVNDGLNSVSKPVKRAKLCSLIFSFAFAIMSPIGIFIVMAMDNASGASEEKAIHIIVLSAISAGTIIYIVFMEIADKSTSRVHINGLVQLVALLIGFGLMHLVSVLFHED